MLFEFDRQEEYRYIILCLVLSYMLENKTRMLSIQPQAFLPKLELFAPTGDM